MLVPQPVTAFDYNTLPSALRSELRAEADFIRAQVKMTVVTIIKTGKALSAIKGKLKHGEFSAWVESECGFTLRTAENYIRAAAFAEGKSETVALLPPATVYKLAAKSAPPEVAQAVIERLEGGATVTQSEIDRALGEARYQKREAARKAEQSARRKRSSKRQIELDEKRRDAEELRRNAEDQKLQRAAAALMDEIGMDNSRLVVKALDGPGGWQLVEHLRRRLEKFKPVAFDLHGDVRI